MITSWGKEGSEACIGVSLRVVIKYVITNIFPLPLFHFLDETYFMKPSPLFECQNILSSNGN